MWQWWECGGVQRCNVKGVGDLGWLLQKLGNNVGKQKIFANFAKSIACSSVRFWRRCEGKR